MNFRRWKKRYFFESKSWWKYDIYWLLKCPCFEVCRGGKYDIFLSQKVEGKIIFTNYWKFLFLNFSEMENMVFFEPKSLWRDDTYWLLKSYCFGLSFNWRVNGKMILTWSFWAFDDIAEFGKYSFSCSDIKRCWKTASTAKYIDNNKKWPNWSP